MQFLPFLVFTAIITGTVNFAAVSATPYGSIGYRVPVLSGNPYWANNLVRRAPKQDPELQDLMSFINQPNQLRLNTFLNNKLGKEAPEDLKTLLQNILHASWEERMKLLVPLTQHDWIKSQIGDPNLMRRLQEGMNQLASLAERFNKPKKAARQAAGKVDDPKETL
ncbi:hypothetical protein BC835DRAFT_1393218 [Cytidiella melzeri]|nr:hypothetical protein BC835DRAFT_1393218 [Cytidiella melzeri]